MVTMALPIMNIVIHERPLSQALTTLYVELLMQKVSYAGIKASTCRARAHDIIIILSMPVKFMWELAVQVILHNNIQN